MIESIETILEEARAGRPFVLIDAPDRENEGDLVIPAQFATAEHIAFMARQAAGLICLAITSGDARRLQLPPMVAQNLSTHGTAFTISIEAREGITTGISAHDRAHTIAVAINPEMAAQDLVMPGHVFPLVARDGGVLVRAGHTEAAVDIARLAGLLPAGVICEIMNEDGSMARTPELIEFALRHALKIGTIADLIAYRRRTERQVIRIGERPFISAYGGNFTLMLYRNTVDGSEHLALVKGQIDPEQRTLVRMHRIDIIADILGEAGERHRFVPDSIQAMAQFPGAAAMVLIHHPGPGSLNLNSGERPEVDRGPDRLRNYGVGAQILIDLGVREMVLLRGSQRRPAALGGYGLNIVEQIDLSHAKNHGG